MHHELLHSQEGIVAHQLVLVMHVVHYQLLPAQLFDHSKTVEGEKINQMSSCQNHKIIRCMRYDEVTITHREPEHLKQQIRINEMLTVPSRCHQTNDKGNSESRL